MRNELVKICNQIIDDEELLNIEDQLSSVQELYEKMLVLNYLSSRNSVSTKAAATQPESKTVITETIPDNRESLPEKPILEENPVSTDEPVIREPEPEPVPQAKEETPPPAQEKHEPREPYKTPEFVRAEEPKKPAPIINESPVEIRELADDSTPEQLREKFQSKDTGSRQSSINDRYGTGSITLGLNDRIAFMNHLFDGSQEDLNRVLSQINTFESFGEAETFIEQMVKPDYNWNQKEEFEMRFMDRVRQRFGE